MQVFDLLRSDRHCDKKSPDYITVHDGRQKSDTQTSPSSNLAIKISDEITYTSRTVATSPKQKSKFHKFWSTGNMGSSSKTSRNGSPTELSPAASVPLSYTNSASNMNAGNVSVGLTSSVEVDEKQRRRAFAHYDCQSLVVKLGYDGRLKSLLSKRRNTTTGASAASMLGTRSTTPDGDSGEEDAGDGRCNDLIER